MSAALYACPWRWAEWPLSDGATGYSVQDAAGAPLGFFYREEHAAAAVGLVNLYVERLRAAEAAAAAPAPAEGGGPPP